MKLRCADRSISHAIVYYLPTTSKKRPYTRKVIKLWNQEHCPLYAEQRQKKLAAWLAEQQRRDTARNKRR